MKTHNVPTDWYAIAIDETADYNIDPADKKHIKAIYGVYMYDKNAHVSSARRGAMYYMFPLYTVIDFKQRADEYIKDELDNKYVREELKAGYYWPVRIIDALAAKYPKQHARYGERGADVEEVREYWSRNSPL